MLREAGSDQAAPFCTGLQRAVLRFLALWLGLYGATAAFAVWLGLLSAWGLVATPFTALTVPVNPQGRGDFYFVTDAG